MNSSAPDRLLVMTVSGPQSEILMNQLRQNNFRFTRIDSHGGVFQEPTVCLMIGFQEDQKGGLLGLIRNNCRPYQKYIPTQGPLPGELAALPMLEAQLGGALVYLLNVEKFEQF